MKTGLSSKLYLGSTVTLKKKEGNGKEALPREGLPEQFFLRTEQYKTTDV